MYNISISEEVSNAINSSSPVVALESTIISHGMPYPNNVETACEVEDIIRSYGATPATIAIIKGVIKVGLSKQELIYLGKCGTEVTKVSRRDISAVVASKLDGATTVSATMIIARKAGINIFATGGIGGVHRGGELSLDISADLQELSRTPVMVVCSGVKSILDIGRTREYLETMGVCVCGYNTFDFPAFYNSVSGYKVDYNIDARLGADILNTNQQLNLNSGIVVGVPVPPSYEMDRAVIDQAISNAIDNQHKLNIVGKDITPYLLSAISKATEGASLATNIHLIKNNAGVAAQIAVEYAKLIKNEQR
ncbi:MAG: pseudouridine-5'-phosphate glycosidase [Clostridia bacterium]